MPSLSPWTLARRADRGRRALLLFVLAALLYGFGLHAARACVAHNLPAPQPVAEASPCHGAAAIDIAEGACEVHCQTDLQTGRPTAFDLPAAAPLPVVPVPALAAPVTPLALARDHPADTGPPLHLLLHRLLR